MKDAGHRPTIKLKWLNQNIPYVYFKIEGLKKKKKLLQKWDCICKIDLKNA